MRYVLESVEHEGEVRYLVYALLNKEEHRAFVLETSDLDSALNEIKLAFSNVLEVSHASY